MDTAGWTRRAFAVCPVLPVVRTWVFEEAALREVLGGKLEDLDIPMFGGKNRAVTCGQRNQERPSDVVAVE